MVLMSSNFVEKMSYDVVDVDCSLSYELVELPQSANFFGEITIFPHHTFEVWLIEKQHFVMNFA